MLDEDKDINFIKSIKAVSRKIQNNKDLIENEAQTRQNLIDPFLDAMGYDHTDLSIVKVEDKADIPKLNGLKKVDYIIYPTKKDEEPTILIEAKYHNSKEKLGNYLKQLKPYFENIRSQEKRVEFGVLTDGIEYRFYSDLDKDNLLDNEPFMVINLEKLTTKDFGYLKKFSRNSLNIEAARAFALEKKYTDKLLAYLKKEIKNTSDDFLEFFKTKIDFKKTHLDELFNNIIKNVFSVFNEKHDILVDIKKNNIEDGIDPGIKDNNIKTENLKKFEKLNLDMKAIYKNLESFIFALNSNEIEKLETKCYTGFRVQGRYFVDFSFRPRVNKINITITAALNQITLKEGFTRYVKNIGKWGRGDIQILCTSSLQMEEIKYLIRLSYNNIISKKVH
ncbi:type I restriction enzyme HsdR N-terminal domain-containing protein [Borreliella afzelii]|uniref:type I restriction enzyme HsdR N-terminal domain-containing protein n=2 Tax=Borreliella afzelii TaxID=29518 RepID=UPI00016B2EF0|nr:type I restriction enzyme r protein (hsdr_n) [Borreliella afzelii ACA-1]